jgi:hypothetical protein
MADKIIYKIIIYLDKNVASFPILKRSIHDGKIF